jgi:serine/threonine-protein kinase
MTIHNLAGQKLGQYELRELLGTGGMGAVYRGYQPALEREVAIKVLSPMLAEEEGYLERFNREAKTAAALEHTHIVPVYDYGTQQDISYVVMRLLSGGTLGERLKRLSEAGRDLPSLGDVADLLKQLSGALDYAHSQGVIHRDIKPNNIMFDHQGSAYLVDFGIAKLVEATSQLTGSGVSVGTPTFMSPEQWRAEPVTPATDIYAVGAMAYLMVTGQTPFEAPTPYALMHKHLNEMPTPPHQVRAEVPPSLAPVLARAMAKDPKARFPSAMAFAQAFDRAIQSQRGEPSDFFTAPIPQRTRPARTALAPPRDETPVIPAAMTTQPLHRHPVVWGLAAVIAVLAAAVIALLATQGGTNEPTAGLSNDASETAAVLAAAVLPTDTPRIPPVDTATEPAAPTATEIGTATPSEMPVAPVETQVWLDLTATATRWTATPTKTPLPPAAMTATYQAQFAAVAQTLTAESWTATPSPTNTATPTPTPLPTDTTTATPSPTVEAEAASGYSFVSPQWTASLDAESEAESYRFHAEGQGAVAIPGPIVRMFAGATADEVKAALPDLSAALGINQLTLDAPGQSAALSLALAFKKSTLFARLPAPNGAAAWFALPLGPESAEMQALGIELGDLLGAAQGLSPDLNALYALIIKHTTTTRADNILRNDMRVTLYTDTLDAAALLNDPDLAPALLSFLKNPALVDLGLGELDPGEMNVAQLRFLLAAVALTLDNPSITLERWIDAESHMRGVVFEANMAFDLAALGENTETQNFTLSASLTARFDKVNTATLADVQAPADSFSIAALGTFLVGTRDQIEGEVAVGQSRSDTLDADTDKQDFFALPLIRRQRVPIQIEATQPVSLRVYGPDGFYIDGLESVTTGEVTLVNRDRGIYLIMVEAAGGADYTVTVRG